MTKGKFLFEQWLEGEGRGFALKHDADPLSTCPDYLKRNLTERISKNLRFFGISPRGRTDRGRVFFVFFYYFTSDGGLNGR